MEPITRAEPLKLRVVLVIAAFVGVATWDPLIGVLIFIMLMAAELLLTPVLWGVSSVFRRFRVPAEVARWALYLPFLCLCALCLWRANPYRREEDFLKTIFVDQIPSGLKVFDSREGLGWDISTFEAWISCDSLALKQVLDSGIYTKEDLSDLARIDRCHMFPSPAQTRVPRQEWLIYKRTTWPQTSPHHPPCAFIITDRTFSWAFVSFTG